MEPPAMMRAVPFLLLARRGWPPGVGDSRVGEHVHERRPAGRKRPLQRRAQLLGPLHELAVPSQGFDHLVVATAELRSAATE